MTAAIARIEPQQQAMQVFSMSDLTVMANAIAKSKLFGAKNPDEAFALMLVAQAEGRHPAIIARDYDIIQGRPAKKSEAMLRDFIAAGGSVKWHALTDECADATFSHPQGGEVRMTWDMERAKAAGLGGKDMWKKYPRQMLRSRTISEGVRTVCPSATSGMYVPEEAADFGNQPAEPTPAPAAARGDEPIDTTAKEVVKPAAELSETDRLLDELHSLMVRKDEKFAMKTREEIRAVMIKKCVTAKTKFGAPAVQRAIDALREELDARDAQEAQANNDAAKAAEGEGPQPPVDDDDRF